MAEANAGEIRARLTLENQDFKRKMADAREEVNKTKDSVQNSKKAFDVLGYTAGAAGMAVVGAIGASVKVAADFQESMARVKAVSGATDTEFQQLTDTARKLGRDTSFSATQAAEAMGYLAMAGFKTNEIIGAMPAVLNLAAANQTELGQSAEIVGNIMRSFGLTAQDTAHAVDVLTKASVDANTDLPDMANAMKYVAPVAHSLGLSLEETASAVALLSNVGIKGEQAGTSLRASLLALANPTGQTAKAMAQLGLSVKNSNGELLPLSDIIDAVSKKLQGMTEAQKVQYASMLVGVEASSAFLALMDQGKGKIDEFTQSLENSGGTAERIAAIQKNTLNAQLESLKGSLEDLGISIGNTFLPALTELTKELTGFVNSINTVDPHIIALGLKVVGLASGIGVAVSAFMKFKEVWEIVFALFRNMTPLGRTISLFLALAPAVMGVVDAVQKQNEVDTTAMGKLMEKQKTLETQINRYEELRNKIKLTNQEIGLYLDYQTEIQSQSDPDVIKAYSLLMADLQKRSGLTNSEFREFLDLNNKLASQVPESVSGYTKLGHAIVGDTKALEDYNAGLVRRIELEYEANRQKLEDNVTQKLRERVELQNELATQINNYNASLIEVAAKEEQIRQLEANKSKFAKTHSADEVAQYQDRINHEKYLLTVMQQELDKQGGQVANTAKLIDLKDAEIAKEVQKFNRIKQTYLAQVGVTAEAGKEVAAINAAVKAQQRKVDELNKQVNKDGKVTDEERKQVKAQQDKLDKLKQVQKKVQDVQNDQDGVTQKINQSTKAAKGMHDVLTKEAVKNVKFSGDPMGKALSISKESARSVSKYVKIDDQGRPQKINDSLARTIYKKVVVTLEKIGDWLGITGSRHTGGTLHELPKYHDGGIVDLPIANRPKFDEVDVRLLRNEMVLTSAQQANLFRMIDTFTELQRDKLLSSRQPDGQIINTTINVGSLVVREEADIKRISEELDRLAKQRQRSRGEY